MNAVGFAKITRDDLERLDAAVCALIRANRMREADDLATLRYRLTEETGVTVADREVDFSVKVPAASEGFVASVTEQIRRDSRLRLVDPGDAA